MGMKPTGSLALLGGLNENKCVKANTGSSSPPKLCQSTFHKSGTRGLVRSPVQMLSTVQVPCRQTFSEAQSSVCTRWPAVPFLPGVVTLPAVQYLFSIRPARKNRMHSHLYNKCFRKHPWLFEHQADKVKGMTDRLSGLPRIC